jgi:hypothetical protein
MPEAETVTLSREKYEAMAEAVRVLRALNNAGVDNWEGYSFAMRELYGDEED